MLLVRVWGVGEASGVGGTGYKIRLVREAGQHQNGVVGMRPASLSLLGAVFTPEYPGILLCVSFRAPGKITYVLMGVCSSFMVQEACQTVIKL